MFYLIFAIFIFSSCSYSLDLSLQKSIEEDITIAIEDFEEDLISIKSTQQYAQQSLFIGNKVEYPIKKNILDTALCQLNKVYSFVNPIERTVYFSFIIALGLIILTDINV